MNNSNLRLHEGIESITMEQFEKLINNSLTSNVFQTIPFYNFFNNQFNSESFAFLVSENDDIIVSLFGVILHETGFKRQLTKRAIIYGGPVIRSNHKNTHAALNLLLEHAVKQLKKKVIYIESRNLNNYSLYHEVFNNCGFRYEPYVNIQIDISNLESTLIRFKSEKRRQIKNALKNNVKIQIANSKNEVESLYTILKELYTTKVKKPLPDLNYFLSLHEEFKRNNNGFICILITNNEIIGGAFCPIDHNTVYDWFRCGADLKYKKLYPSTLAVYAGISIGIEKGLKLYDFMGAGNKTIPYGVRDFKSQFGGELVEHGRYLKVLNPALFNIGKIGLNVIQRFKLNI